jgi:multiple sugar transport system substrate-binding protein
MFAKRGKKLIVVSLILYIFMTAQSFAAGQSEEAEIDVPDGAVVVEFWTGETEADRMENQKKMAADFMAKNPGIVVKIVPVDENDLDSKFAAAKAGNNLPDVVQLNLAGAVGKGASGLLDIKMTTEIIKGLGVDTFSPASLDLVTNTDKSGYYAVPLDAFLNCIYYRKDLFKETGIPVPDSWSSFDEAAAALADAPARFGAAIGSNPEKAFTQQAFDMVALSNNARIFDKDGNVIVNSPEMVEAVEWYASMVKKHNPPGYIDWKEVNQYYLTDRIAMGIYATYLLGDIAGVRDRDWAPVENLPSNTGVLASITGPDGKVGALGEMLTLGVVKGADEASKKWVEYIMSDGYIEWLFMAVYGKAPVRPAYLDEWKQHPIIKQYDQEAIDNILKGINAFEKLGFVEGRSFPIIDKINSTYIFPRAIDKVVSGMSAKEAVDWIEVEINKLING